MSKSPSNQNYHATELFDQFINGTTLRSVLISFRRICLLLDLEPGPFNQFYPTLKKGIVCNKNWKSQSIFSKIEKKAFNKIYHSSGSSSGRSSGIGGGGGSNSHHHHHHSGSPHGSNSVLKNNNCLVIGGGPCGLRTAIELQLLGAHHVIITEKRDRFSRNNVLHLWPFVIADLKQLAGKKFYGKFCAGSIDHVSIRQLQLMLLKVALIIGCEFIENVTFEEICPHNIRSSRESIKETSPESEVDGSSTSKPAPHQSPTKRKLYSTAEEIECNKKGTNCDSTPTPNDNQENQDISNIVKNGSDNNNKIVDCSSSSSPSSNDYHGVGKTESRRLSICSCCCHLHRSSSSSSESGRLFWSHLSKNYIGAYAHFSLTSSTPSTATTLVNYDLLLEKLHTYPFDILIGGDGRRNTLNDNFPRKEFRGKLAIAITANFINNHTLAEAQIPEISGISFIYHQEMFKSLYDETGIDLENICYYKDDTHYFVMTAKKSSLLQRGVLINDYSDTRALLASTNIDRSQLLAYARDAAKWTTGLDTPNFALNHYGEADVAMFDFTSMYAADNACRAMRIVRTGYPDYQHNCSRCNCDNEPCKKSKSDTITDVNDVAFYNKLSLTVDNDQIADVMDMEGVEGDTGNDEGLLLISLVGDSLLEPFWPTGSGCGRGFLSAMDAAWLVRQWSVKRCKSIRDEEKILQVLSEREAIYRLLAQTKSENLSQNCASYTINPVTRYPNLNSSTLLPHQCRHLLYDHLPLPVIEPRSKLTMAEKRARRATIATTSPFSRGSGRIGASGEGEVIMESRARVEREFMAISRERERNQRNNESNTGNGERFVGYGGGRSYGGASTAAVTMEDDENNLAAHREFEDSLAAFEENYRGLMSSDNDPTGLGLEGTQLSISVPNRSNVHNVTNFALDLSPSASNLITMAKSRARDIESAFRHRRQRQSQFKRSETNTDDLPPREGGGGGGKVHQKAQQQCINHLRQQLRSKAAWFLDQKASEAANSDKESSTSLIKRESFNGRIKDLEAKLYAASGLSYLSDENSDQGKDDPGPPVKLPSTMTGINVMMTASQLQQLFNPKFQEEKLRQQAKLKSTKDIKYVGKITKSDWNVKPFEEGTINSESNKATNCKPKTPPPPQRVELFRNKLNEIQSKLEHIDDHHQPERRSRLDSLEKGGGGGISGGQGQNGEWISMLKNELNEKATKKPEIQVEPSVLRKSPSTLDNPFRKEARREAAANLSQSPSSFNKLSKSPTSTAPTSSAFKEKITIVGRSGPTASKVCAKCGLIVATVDKILISGTLFHRSCLKCISCGVTLRMSEVRNTDGSTSVGSLASLITGTVTVLNNNSKRDRPYSGHSRENGSFNYKCTDCNSGKPPRITSTSTSVIGKLMGNHRYDVNNIKSSITSLSSVASSSSASSGVTPTTTIDNRMTSSFDGNLEPLAKSMSARLVNKMASTTDDYEARLKERMKWKEMFLLNNDNINLTGGLNSTNITGVPGASGSIRGLGQTATDGVASCLDGNVNGGNKKKANLSPVSGGRRESSSASKAEAASESFRNRLNERIEYENISMTSEMVDDDELTKLLNLGSDHWDSGGEVDDDDDDEEEDDESDKDGDSEDSDDDDDEEEDDDENDKVPARGGVEGGKSPVKGKDGKSDTKGGGNTKDNDANDDDDDEDEDGDVDDGEDRQTTSSASDSWDTSDSTDNDFDSDQFDESGVSDAGDLINQRTRHLITSSSSSLDVAVVNENHLNHQQPSTNQQLHSKSSSTINHHHRQRKSSVKEGRLKLPQIVVHKEPTESSSTVPIAVAVTPTNESREMTINTIESTLTTSDTSYQPNESLSTITPSQQSSELVTSSDTDHKTIPMSDSTLRADEADDKKGKDDDGEGGDDDDKTEKNSSSPIAGLGSDDSDTINSKINDLEDANQQEKPQQETSSSTTLTTLEEQEFQLIVNEMEKKSNQTNVTAINSNNNVTINKPILKTINCNNNITDDPVSSSSDNNNFNYDSDDDSKTSLSSLSIAVSDTYDDINLLSVWDESGNCEDPGDSAIVKPKSLTKKSTKSSNRKGAPSSSSSNKRQTINETNDSKRSTVAMNVLFKSKTDVSIPANRYHHNLTNNNRADYLGRRGLESSGKNRATIYSDAKKDDKSSSSSRLSSTSSSSSNIFKETGNYGSKLNYPYSVDSNYDYNETNYLQAKMSASSKGGGETYSKIPVLAARVIAANEGVGIKSIDFDQSLGIPTINETSQSTTTTTTVPSSKYKPSYSGSFTEKLLQRCRSSPSIPLIGDSITSRWSTSKLQLSSPTKVLNLTKALNAQTANNASSPPSQQQQQQLPWSKLIKSQHHHLKQQEPHNNQQQSTSTTKRQQSHCSLPFADSPENASSIHQQSKQSNRSTINSSITSSSSPSSRGQLKPSPNQFKQNINPTLPRITGTTIKTVNPTIDSTKSSTSKLFQAPRATFDEDMFDDDDDETLERISSSSSSSSSPSRKHQVQQSNYQRQRHRSPIKPAKTSIPSPPESNQVKLKPIKINLNN